MSQATLCDECGAERPHAVSVERDRWWRLVSPHSGELDACSAKCGGAILRREDRDFLRVVRDGSGGE